MNWQLALTDIDLGEEEIEAVTKVLRSKWLTMGPVTAEFEKRFAEKMGVKHAFAVNNCTAALHLANLVVGVQPGDEVICPTLTFVASANASKYTGAEVVFADVISEDDLTIDPKDVEAKVTPKTKAITVVHYAGFACQMDQIMEIAHKYNLKVIEDCAHAPFGQCEYPDGSRRFVGAIGDVGCFSFFGNKNMTTGEGGMVTTNDDALAEKIRLLRSHGMTTLTYDRFKGHASTYDVVGLGYNYRMDDIHSAIGLCQLDKVDRLNQQRRQVYQWYLEETAGSDDVRIPFSSRNLEYATCHIVPAIVRNNADRVRAKLKDEGIQTSKHYELIPSFSIYKNSRAEGIKFDPGHLITLPISPFMTQAQVKGVISAIGSVE